MHTLITHELICIIMLITVLFAMKANMENTQVLINSKIHKLWCIQTMRYNMNENKLQ